MAQSLQLQYVLAATVFALSFKGAITSHHNVNHGRKSLLFALYQHDILNKTSYIVVNGVAGAGLTNITSLFGTLFAFQDPLTVTPNPSSKVIGLVEGASITSSFDGPTNLAMFKISLRLKHHKRSISVVGSGNNIKASDLPVLGGTGDFVFVRWYVTYSLVGIKDFNIVNKVEFHLYWSPYVI